MRDKSKAGQMFGQMMEVPLFIGDILRHAARTFGSTEIVSSTLGTDRLHRYSYADAHKRCLRLSRALRELGLGLGDRVGSLAWSTHQHFELFYGVTGGGVVLNAMNPRFAEEVLAEVITHCGARWIFIDSATLPLAEKLEALLADRVGWIYMDESAEIPVATLAQLVSYEGLLAEQEDDYDWPEIDERSASVICYTSGTGGEPKGVVYSHRSIVLSTIIASADDLTGLYRSASGQAVMPIVTFFHGLGWLAPFTAPFNGQKLVLPGRNFDPAQLCALMHSEKVTIGCAVPTIWALIAQYLADHGRNIPSLRIAIAGGAKVPPRVTEALKKRGVLVAEMWGMTEAVAGSRSLATTKPSGRVSDEVLWRTGRQGRIGFGTSLRIVDDQGVKLPSDGIAVGNLQARGNNVASGYYNVPNQSRYDWLETGDVAKIYPDATFEILDRSKDMIKSGGEWISSVAIEAAAAQHPSLNSVAVIPIHHPKWQERPLLVAQLRDGVAATPAEILKYLSSRIPKWWMPEAVVFVESLPMTSNGKVLKTALRERFADILTEEAPGTERLT